MELVGIERDVVVLGKVAGQQTDEAEEAYENAFLSGLTPNLAREVAMNVLMEGFE